MSENLKILLKKLEYEDDAQELYQILSNMMVSAPWLFSVHDKLDAFVRKTYLR